MLTENVRRAAAEFGSRVAYVAADGWTISYAELDRAADEVAAALRAMGLGDRATVALVLESTIDYVALYLGLARIGAVAAGINPRLRPRETNACLAALGPDLVVASAELMDGVAKQHPRHMISVGDSARSLAGGLRHLGAPPAAELARDDDRPVCVCFTSGSTGDPRGAWFTGRQLRAIAHLDTGGAWGAGGHGIASTQFAHVGFMTKLPWLLASGQTTHLLERWSAGPVLRLISDNSMTAIAAVAPQIALLLAHPLVAELDFSAVQAIVAGGATSPPEMVSEARRRFGAPYSIRYSSTESGGIGLGTALDAADDEALHTIGRPRPGTEAEVRAPSGAPVPAGAIGELWLRSPTVMSGYWRDPDGTAETLVDGWLRTGDLARVDEAGCFRLAGRIKEMFIRGGYNVYPMEIESVLGAHPQVNEIAIVPTSDEVMGEIGVAVVVASDPSSAPSLESLREFGAGLLASYKLPEAVRYVDALPRNAGNKLDRLTLSDPGP